MDSRYLSKLIGVDLKNCKLVGSRSQVNLLGGDIKKIVGKKFNSFGTGDDIS